MEHVTTDNLVIGDVVAYEGRWHAVIGWTDEREDLRHSSIAVQLRRLDSDDECECVALPEGEWRLKREARC